MDSISEFLNQKFGLQSNGQWQEIQMLPAEFPAYVANLNHEFGVFIETDTYTDSLEKFHGCRLQSRQFALASDEKLKNYLCLTCDDYSLKKQFSIVCSDFVDPGNDGVKRKKLLENPENFWSGWKKLLGNAVSNKSLADVAGELFVLLDMIEHGLDPVWNGPEKAVHDIATEHLDVEVKTTTRRYANTVTMHGQNQMVSEKPLFLAFVRLARSDKSEKSESINSLKDKLCRAGYDCGDIDRKIRLFGFESGEKAMKEEFKLLSLAYYPVDSNFPQITPASFKNDRIPNGIQEISYEVALDNLLSSSSLPGFEK